MCPNGSLSSLGGPHFAFRGLPRLFFCCEIRKFADLYLKHLHILVLSSILHVEGIDGGGQGCVWLFWVSQRVRSSSWHFELLSLSCTTTIPAAPQLWSQTARAFKWQFSGKNQTFSSLQQEIYWKRVRGKQGFACSTCLNVARNGFVQEFCCGTVLRESPGAAAASFQRGFGAFFPLVFFWSWLDKWELCVRRVCVIAQQTCSREGVGIR